LFQTTITLFCHYANSRTFQVSVTTNLSIAATYTELTKVVLALALDPGGVIERMAAHCFVKYETLSKPGK